MTIKSFRLLVLFLLAGWQLAWADATLDATAPATAVSKRSAADPAGILEKMQTAPPRGLLYKITKNGRTAYLFGTVHVGTPDFFPLDMATTQALAQSSELVVELDPTQTDKMQAAMQRYAVIPPSQRRDAQLPPALKQRLLVQANALNMSSEIGETLKPWMSALSLVIGSLQKSGYSPEYAADLYLIGLARGLNKPIAELESIDSQLQLFDSLPRQAQLAFLDETLTLLESGQMVADTQALIDAWLKSDASMLHTLSLKSFRENPRSATWMKKKLFSERNQLMAQKIDHMLNKGSSPFIAVGSLHLTGKEGLPALLKKQGYRITSLYPESRPK